jgi:hypothetical protein
MTDPRDEREEVASILAKKHNQNDEFRSIRDRRTFYTSPK